VSIVTKEMLDAAVIVGQNQERERIIKLLEDLISTYGNDAQMSVLFLKMLIKGENK